MSANQTFRQLRDFWAGAYRALKFSPQGATNAGVLEMVVSDWVDDVLTRDGVSADSVARRVFSRKPPEPYFGRWTNAEGDLDLRGKTLVVLINPGDGISFAQAADPRISLAGREHWRLLREYYTTGHVEYANATHSLLYKRALLNPQYSYWQGTKRFGWGWWAIQWANMLASLGETRAEEEVFVTLELFAYSSAHANELTPNRVAELHSSQLVVQLVGDLALGNPNALSRIVLVNKANIWKPLLLARGVVLQPMAPRNKAGLPRAFRGVVAGMGGTQVPLVVLHQAQQMRFPVAGADASAIFG